MLLGERVLGNQVAEQSVLGAVLSHGERFECVDGEIEPEHFYWPEHAIIFDAIRATALDNRPIDVITVSDKLANLGKLEAVGGLSYLVQLVEGTPVSANLNSWIRVIRKFFTARTLKNSLIEITDYIHQNGVDDPERLIDFAEGQMVKVSSISKSDAPVVSLKSQISQTLREIEDSFSNKGVLQGVSSGFRALDSLTCGFSKGDLILIAGRPSMGKTLLGVNIAEVAAIKEKKRVAIFSMEMSSVAILKRMYSSLGRINQTNIRNGNLEDEDWPRLQSATDLLVKASANFMICDDRGLTINQIRSKSRKCAKTMGGVDLIVVDYLQLIRGDRNAQNRNLEISDISCGLKNLAGELGCPVIALSQLSRNLENRPNKRPIMADLRDSGSLEQDADLILMLYRDEVYNEDSPDRGTAEIIISKQRNGQLGTARVKFYPQYCRFDNF